MNCDQVQDLLDEYAAGSLPAAERAALEQHLATCDVCRSEADRVVPLLREVVGLPRRIEPPVEVWRGIAEKIEKAQRLAPAPRWPRWPILAAAALVLMTLSSAVTVMLLRHGPRERVTVATSLSRDFLTLEAEYSHAAGEIAAALHQGRVTIAPQTRAILERNLRIIDAAIEESRAALAKDPANRELEDMVLTTWQHKLDLLRRAAAT